jgi:hypothetical protein
MEENFNKLDNFLRKHLNDASEDRAWNVPDDAIFEKAMRTVAEQKKKKRRGWILIPILLGAGLMVSEYFNYRQIETLQGKIMVLEENLARASAATDPLSSTSSDLREVSSSPQATTSIEKQENNSFAPASETFPNTQLTPNPTTSNSLPSNQPTIQSASKTKSLDKKSTPPKSTPLKSLAPQTKDSNRLPAEIVSNTDQARSTELPAHAGSEKPNSLESSKNRMTSPLISSESETGKIHEAGVTGMPFTDSWITMPMSLLELKDLETQTTWPVEMSTIAANPTGSLQKTTLPVFPMQYGILLGGNQSWLTMSNIPPGGNASLYDYDNDQPGFSMQGFVNKPVSRRFSIQTGLGYHVYKNKSIMEDQFLLDSNSVILMPDGQSMYQTDYNLMNPIGDYDMLLEFRVSEQMHQNDTIIEYSQNEQTIQSVMLDLGVHYDLLTLPKVKISLGTGFGLGYMAGLKNEFNVSTYYNGILQKNQMETPDQLNNVKRWYGQWLGNLNVGYYPTERLGMILSAQYNTGLTSIRDGGSTNGPLTFLHSFSLSAGISTSF